MLGFYVYCIRPAQSPRFSAPGIDKKHRLSFFPFKDIEAVASRVSIKEFGSEKIQRKAQKDVRWIKDMALRHARIVQKAVAGTEGSAIPMKFGTIFKTQDNLEKSLKQRYQSFKKTLLALKGKEEWGAKIHFKPEVFKKKVQEESPEARRKKDEMSLQSGGSAYFFEKELDEFIERLAQAALWEHKQLFLRDLAETAPIFVENKVIGKELTAMKEPMVLNAAFLIPKNEIAAFRKKVENLDRKFRKSGFLFFISGPWPPYNFV